MGLFTSMSLNIRLRLRKLKSYILSELLYGFESWTIKSDMKEKLKAVEMWFLRRKLRVSWIARRRINLAVMEMAGTSR